MRLKDISNISPSSDSYNLSLQNSMFTLIRFNNSKLSKLITFVVRDKTFSHFRAGIYSIYIPLMLILKPLTSVFYSLNA